MYDEQTIRSIIDRGHWKHSWHLPKTDSGHIKWTDPETKRRVRELLNEAINEGLQVAKLAHEQLLEIEKGEA